MRHRGPPWKTGSWLPLQPVGSFGASLEGERFESGSMLTAAPQRLTARRLEHVELEDQQQQQQQQQRQQQQQQQPGLLLQWQQQPQL
ncbi:hypothetical protein Emed_006900 [Eimeria media]